MSKHCHCIVLVLIGFTLSQVSAQPPGARRGGGIRSPLDLDRMFVGYRSIRSELELTASQLELLNALDKDLAAQRSRGFRRRPARGQIGRGQTERNQVSRKLFAALLEPEQAKRLAQINLQFRGLYAIDDAAFVEDVSLSDEQVSAVRKARRENPNFDMTKLNDLVGLETAKQWWTTLGFPFVFSEELQQLRSDYRGRQSAGRARRERP